MMDGGIVDPGETDEIGLRGVRSGLINRRSFLLGSAAGLGALGLAGCCRRFGSRVGLRQSVLLSRLSEHLHRLERLWLGQCLLRILLKAIGAAKPKYIATITFDSGDPLPYNSDCGRKICTMSGDRTQVFSSDKPFASTDATETTRCHPLTIFRTYFPAPRP